MSNISPEQLDLVREWAAQGVDLNGIQKNLAAECGVHMTYMDVRFLLLDNGIEIATPQPKPAPKAEEPALEAPAPAPETPAAEPVEEPAPAFGKLELTLDEIQIPGALISGKVAFPSGTKGSWLIDQTGRFGFRELTGTPTPQEMQDFQVQLTQLLSQV